MSEDKSTSSGRKRSRGAAERGAAETSGIFANVTSRGASPAGAPETGEPEASGEATGEATGRQEPSQQEQHEAHEQSSAEAAEAGADPAAAGAEAASEAASPATGQKEPPEPEESSGGGLGGDPSEAGGLDEGAAEQPANGRRPQRPQAPGPAVGAVRPPADLPAGAYSPMARNVEPVIPSHYTLPESHTIVVDEIRAILRRPPYRYTKRQASQSNVVALAVERLYEDLTGEPMPRYGADED